MSQPVTIRSLSQSRAPLSRSPSKCWRHATNACIACWTLLFRLRDHLRAHGADEQARQAARDVMRYFDQAAPQHHQDEELHVFPAVGSGDPATVAVVERLQQDHLQMEIAVGGRARRAVRAWNGEPRPVSRRSRMRRWTPSRACTPITSAAEEQIAYPAAAAAMDAPAQAGMGAEMMRRRGVLTWKRFIAPAQRMRSAVPPLLRVVK